MSLFTCAHCHHATGLPGPSWLTVMGTTGGLPTTLCSARCAVLWLESQHAGRPL